MSAAQLSRNAQALWALCQAPGTAGDDAEGVLLAVPGLPRAPPPLRDANGQPALEVRANARTRAQRTRAACVMLRVGVRWSVARARSF